MTTTTHDDNATTWRDLADQLTPKQVERLTDYEQRWNMPADEKCVTLLNGAREYIEQNLTNMMFGHVATPEGAADIYAWGQRDDGRSSREFAGTQRPVLGVCVSIDGTQFEDGTIKRAVNVSVDDLPRSTGGALDATTARELAAALIEAADELERLSD